ncbi:MAG: SUMF1/EgtB/PvdO family nonheme iron enzyme [Polyangiaceae bacterium]|nr:SUMF1/EgtB/PvdO family nonheme iron enzyme [Polyangiaceae bacterium]
MSEGKLNRDTWLISPNRVRQALQSLASESETECLSDRLVASQTPSVASADEIALTVAQAERYAYAGELGRGGMGRVDAVFDRALGRTIARKTTLPDRGHPALLVAEAQICAQLEHPSIVPVYDVGADEGGAPHYTMRVVRGRTLRQVLSDNETSDKPHLGLFQLLGILRQVCLVVDYAHSRGVIHRDLTPENIIVGEFGEVYVLDWGVAHVSETSDIRRSRNGAFNLDAVGSLGYMAPEQALGELITPMTDVFALGVILFEVLTGERPFDDSNIDSIRERITRPLPRPPSLISTKRITTAFDHLVTSCLEPWPQDRPASARILAEAIEAFLDGERARAEREREAAAYARDGERARAAFEALDAEARRLQESAEASLATISPWEPAARKHAAWALAQEGRRLASEAARALARAEAAFTRSLGRVPDHSEARRGLTALYFRQFEAAEARGDHELMAQYLDLARAYDDGTLRLELADQGALVVDAPAGAEVTVARYEPHGLLLRCGARRLVGAEPCLLDSGSYLVTAQHEGREVRYPLLIERAKEHHLRLRFPAHGEVPEGLILIPGGPFLAYPPRAKRAARAELPDFAIGRFPVTFREYIEFLESISDPQERERRTPGHGRDADPLIVRDGSGGWQISARCVEGEARKRVPRGRELDLPVHEISWYDAVAYTRWLAQREGRDYRLPTDLEWEKAARGADGRSFPMGNQLDASFAKLRESRPEASQPEVIGAFEDDRSPYGVRDLAGGVADWTSTSLDGAPLPDLSAEGTPAADERQAIWRGGTWGTTAAASRAMRYSQMLRHRSVLVGFRVALSLDAGGSSRLEIRPLPRPDA